MLEFYHCTSDIFLDSIKKHGLGKINPNFDLNLLKLLRYLHQFSNENLPDNKALENLKFTTLLMINQEILHVDKKIYNVDILNFKHDGLFVSLGHLAAIIHLHCNKYGSEILTRIIAIIKILLENNIKIKIPKSIDNFDVLSLINKTPKSIFIKIKRLDYNFLYNNSDIPMQNSMLDLENLLSTAKDEKVISCFKQTTIFKYIKNIELDDLEISYIEYDGQPFDKDFEYYLTSVK